MSSCISNSRDVAVRYLTTYGLLVTSGAILVASLDFVVDPYSVFGMRRIAGFNANKLDIEEHLRLTNAYSIDRLKPDALIVGTSRAGHGLSPEHPVWRGMRCYNTALPGSNIYEFSRYVQHANGVHPLKAIVIGLDFRSFQSAKATSEFSENRLVIKADGTHNSRFFSATLPDLAGALLSRNALVDSLRTVRYQRWATTSQTEKGFWLEWGNRHEYAKVFPAYTENTFRRYAGYAAEPFDIDEVMAPLRTILLLAHARNIDLRMFFSPSHAWHWQTMEIAGMLPRFEAIKRAVIRTNEDVAREVGGKPFPLWDFSGYNSFSEEAVSRSDGVRMQWFRDPLHYTPALGSIVLDRVMERTSAPPEEGFGVRLNSRSIEGHLAQWRQAQLDFEGEHPDVRETVTRVYQGISRVQN